MNPASHNNNDDRFLKLIADNRPRLLRICRVYAWNRADQDDLHQEMLFQIWRALPNLREEAQTWRNTSCFTWPERKALLNC